MLSSSLWPMSAPSSSGKGQARKQFPRGIHNDGRFVRLGMSDADFTGRLVERLRGQLAALPASVERVLMVQHHPPVRELFYPSPLATAGRSVRSADKKSMVARMAWA